MKIFTLVVGILLCTALAAVAADRELQTPLLKGPYKEAQQTGNLTNPALTEISGIAASRRRPDVLWVLNDGGNGAVLYAIGLEDEISGVFHVSGVKNRDWEDLASFRSHGTAFLLIADVGDNNARRKTCVLYIVQEPKIPRAQEPTRGTQLLYRRTRFVYEDGPRDCESVAVDRSSDTILLLSKRDMPPRLYELPLFPSAGASLLTARFLGQLTTIPPPTEKDLLQDPIYGRFRSQPTAMDIDPSGRVAVTLTYGHAYRYKRAPTESWEAAFSRFPEILVLPELKQAESLCIGSDGHTIFVTSERRPTYDKRPVPLLRMERINDKITNSVQPE